MTSPFIIQIDGLVMNNVIGGVGTITLPIYIHTGLTVNWGITGVNDMFYSQSDPITLSIDPNNNPNLSQFASGTSCTITVDGDFTKFGTNVPPLDWNSTYLVSIDQWGSAPIEDLSYACAETNLSSVPATLPSTVTNVSYMFYSQSPSSNFTQDLSWDVSGVTDFDFFMSGNGGMTDSTLSNLNSPFNKAAMKLTFSQDIANLPIVGIGGNIGVDWGDGDMKYTYGYIEFSNKPSVFGSPTVLIYGKFTTFGSISSSQGYLKSVDSWGTNNTILNNLSYAFAGAADLITLPSTLPSTVTNVEGMFKDAYVTFVPNAGPPTQYSSWNMANVTNLNFMFDSDYFDTSPASSTATPPVIGPSTTFGQTISIATKKSRVNNFTIRKEVGALNYDSTRTWPQSPFYIDPMELVISGSSGPLELPISGIIGNITVVWVEAGIGGVTNTIQGSYIDPELVSFPSGQIIPSAVFTVRIFGYFTNFSVESISTSSTTGWPGSQALLNMSAFGKNPILTSLKGAFAFCNSMVPWPPMILPTSVTNLSYLCFKATPTNSISIPVWDTTNVTDVAYAFAGSSVDTSILTGWITSGITKYDKFAFFITNIEGTKDFSISSSGSPFRNRAMAITVLPSYVGAIQLSDIGTDGIAIDYNEGSGAQYVGPSDPVPAHFYTNPTVNGTIYIYGSFGHFGAPDLSGHQSAEFITGISSWGTSNSNLTSLANAFNGGFNGGGTTSTYANDLETINLPPSLPSTVTNLSGMFANCPCDISGISLWDLSGVTDTSFMFYQARDLVPGKSSFNSDIGLWNVSNVTDMSYMFNGAVIFNGDISWNTVAVTNMSYMFKGATAFAGTGLNSWDTGSVTNMSHMFEDATTVGNVFDTWNVSNVTDMSYMFKGATGMGSTSYLWDVSKVVDMSHMFEGTGVDLQAGSWKPKRCANFSYMFAGVNLSNLTPNISLAPWASYIGISAKQINKVNFMTEGTNDITNLTSISPFWSDPTGTNTPKSYVGNVGRGGFPMAMSFVCPSGTYISLPISNQDGEVLIDWGDGQVNWYPLEFTGLYEHYTRISNPGIGIYANFNNFGANLWPGVNKVVSIDGWGTTNKIVNFSNAFKGATILTTVPSILTTTARNLFSMFKDTILFNQDLGGWEVSRVTDFSDMFFQSIAFVGTGLGKWKPRAAQDMSRMFSGAAAFNTNLKPWCAYLGVLTGPVSHINFFTGSDTTNPNSPWYTGYTTAPSRTPMAITFQPTPYTAQNPLIFPPNVSGTAYISLPITGVSGDLFIDWGDGTKNLYSQNQQPTLSAWAEVYEHVDLSGSNHQVKIYGDFTTFGERYNGDAKLSAAGTPAVVWFGLHNVLSVVNWGDNALLSSLKQAFQLSAFSLTAVPSNIPRTVKNTASMFLATPLFVGSNLALWDVSGLTNVSNMFAGAAAFTADLSGWTYKLGPVSAYDSFFSTTTFGMSGFTDPTSESPRSPFYTGVPTPSNPYVPATSLVMFNTQPNPTIKVGTEVFGTVGSVLYSLDPSYNRITDVGLSATFVGTLYRPYIASTSISNKIYGAHTGGKLISYDTVTRTLDLSAGTYQGTPTGYMALDTSGNLYSSDSSGYIYKLIYDTTSFVALNTTALLPPIIGPLSIVNNVTLYGCNSDNRIVQMTIPGVDGTAIQTPPLTPPPAPTSLIVDSSGKPYYYDTSGYGLWTLYPPAKLHDFSGNPLDGTQPVGSILMDPTKRVLYGICSAGGRGIGTGLRGAGTLFSFDLSSSEYSVLVNYVAGDVNRGETPLDFSITTETGTAYVITRSSSTTFQPRIVGPRVANGYAVGSAQLPGATTTCFNHGTKILSLMNDIEAWIPVESLNIGDLVMTYLHGPRPITHIFKGVMINNPAVWHTCMYKGQKAGFEPLLVTGGHGLLVDYLTEEEQAKQQKFWGREEVIIDDKIVMIAPVSAEFTQITDRDIYTYYHFVVENDGDNDRRYGVYANGFLTETPSKNQAVVLKYKDHSVY